MSALRSTTYCDKSRISDSPFRWMARLVLLLGMAVAATAAPFDQTRVGDAPVRIERGFAFADYGQLHYRRASPLDPDLIRATPVVCFHQTPNLSQVFI